MSILVCADNYFYSIQSVYGLPLLGVLAGSWQWPTDTPHQELRYHTLACSSFSAMKIILGYTHTFYFLNLIFHRYVSLLCGMRQLFPTPRRELGWRLFSGEVESEQRGNSLGFQVTLTVT